MFPVDGSTDGTRILFIQGIARSIIVSIFYSLRDWGAESIQICNSYLFRSRSHDPTNPGVIWGKRNLNLELKLNFAVLDLTFYTKSTLNIIHK